MKQKDKLEIIRKILKTKLPNSHDATMFVDFVNVDTNNLNEITAFCRKHNYLLGDHPTKKFDELFKQKQTKVASFLKAYISKSLSQKDLDNLNEKLANCKRQVRFVRQEELTSINEQIDVDTNTHLYPATYLIPVYSYPNLTDHIWLYLSEFILKEQPLFECLNCARFFLPDQNRKRKFCTDECKYEYHARKNRDKNS